MKTVDVSFMAVNLFFKKWPTSAKKLHLYSKGCYLSRDVIVVAFCADPGL